MLLLQQALTIGTQALEGVPVVSLLYVDTEARVEAGVGHTGVHLLTVHAYVSVTTLALKLLL